MKKTPPYLSSVAALVGIFMVHSVYLAADGSASLWNVANILVHVPLAVAITVSVWLCLKNELRPRRQPKESWLLAAVLLFTVVTGIWIVARGNTFETRLVVALHGVGSLVATGVILIYLINKLHQLSPSRVLLLVASIVAIGSVVLIFAGSESNPIRNEILPPTTMAEAAMGGETGPFFPSPARTTTAGLLPEEYFLDSAGCGRSGCHVDAYEQWNRSAHHFASFNNQWYRKSIEYMQDVVGTRAPKWCAGCHDHALLFSGQMEQPVEDFISTEAAHAGIGCISCHGVAEVQSTGGNGALVLDYPAMHDLATTDNRIVRRLHDLVVRLDPEPHRKTFLKEFHTDQVSQFCSSCHKVHLDRPVNNYRWLRGFNTYDNWQASGVSHEGARSFYEPDEAMTCATCHMPAVPSSEPGSKDGLLKSHDFIAANMALPVANGDSVQLARTREFLERGHLRVDVFAVSRPLRGFDDEVDISARNPQSFGELSSTFPASDERAGMVGAGSRTSRAVPVVAPLHDGMPAVEPGTTVRLDVVVRTVSLGHFFPTGTVDAQEAWLEVKVVDDRERILLWSGSMDDAGVVDSSAHYYRSLMIDGRGNPIDKRNAWAARSVVYANLIPPGSADVGHYQFRIPEDSRRITLYASVNYRKFFRSHTQFAFAGEMVDGSGEVTTDYDDRHVRIGTVESVSGQLTGIPELPVIEMASDSLVLDVGIESDGTVTSREREERGEPRPWERWNDYGIALLREGDLRGAEEAFRQVASDDSQRVRGLTNLGRVYLEEGDLSRADSVLSAASVLDPDDYKVKFFRGTLYRARGEYDSALRFLDEVHDVFPEDRVVLNEIGRALYLNEDFEAAIESFEDVLEIDAEDLMAHYNLMLAYRATGNLDRSREHETRYVRYKADEASMALAREYRMRHPADNTEAQPIHVHVATRE